MSKETSLKEFISKIQKTYGKETIQLGSEIVPKARIAFGHPDMDKFTGGGAVIGGTVIVYGAEGTGKSYSCLLLTAEAQRKGQTVLYIDLERKFDPVRARALGIDIDKNFLLVTTNEQMRTAENAMDIIIAAAQSKAIGLVIVDSIQAMSPQGEQETKKGKELDMAHDEMALLAKKMSKFYARINPYMANVALVMVGQARDTGLGTFMVKEGLSGGRSGKHWATIILHFRRGQGVNAPKEYEYNSAGEIVRDKNGEKVSHYVGFEMVVGLEKMHISGGAMEKSELRMTFYYKSGLFMPDEKEPRANANDGGAPATPSSCTDNKVAEAKPTGKKRGPKPKVKEEAK